MCTPCRSNFLKSQEGYVPKTYTIKASPRKQRDTCLEGYFEVNISLLNKTKRSEESGNRINEPSKVNICHIFPKRKYKSVQCNLDNVLFLTWDEHSRFDKLLDELRLDDIKREFPNAWENMTIKVRKLLPQVVEVGKLKIALEEELL
jgi:hypothetical protein